MYVILWPAEDESLTLPTRELKYPFPLQKRSKKKETNKTKGTKNKPVPPTSSN